MTNKALPWQNKGRWYRIFLESDGTNYVEGPSDIEYEINGAYMKFNQGFHVIDFKYDINCKEEGNASSLVHGTRHYADGSQGIHLPNKAYFDHAYIYVFGYNE